MENATSSTLRIKQEIPFLPRGPNPTAASYPTAYIDLSSSSDSDSEAENSRGGENDVGLSGPRKRSRPSDGSVKIKKHKALPVGFLDPLPTVDKTAPTVAVTVKERRQFWKAGDYDGSLGFEDSLRLNGVGMDHVRVHPKFLHSNATSHKWALGAFAELLDNSLDEACHGATFVNIDVIQNKKDGTKMLLIEDNGGGMDPDNMRKCMSLGYSAKNKIANTIGQYGNGFKTSTMRLGADAIVFSRSRGKDGKSPTQSIGMLSYTFLTNTGKEDIVVPMLDYEKIGHVWNKSMRSSSVDWNINVETIIQWSPYSSEAALLEQFNSVAEQGTRIVIYNLWYDDQGQLELDFDTDKEDIQLGGANRDKTKVEMASQYPNSRHFLTYHHSLRSYASILYLRVPSGLRMILRGKEIENHKLVNDMMSKDTIRYSSKYSHAVTDVTLGFVKDAEHHIDIQGFNVYHKNRLIKPFWRVWNAAGSDGRGVIGVLEADFVEPAHDKQGFEMTTVLRRLETCLVKMQKNYWYDKCEKIGYARRRNKKQVEYNERENSFEDHNLFRSGKSPPAFGRSKYLSRPLSHSNMMGKSAQHRSRLNSDSDFDTEYYPSRKSTSGRPIITPQKYSQNMTSQPTLSPSPLSDNNNSELNVTSNGVEDGITARSQFKVSSVTHDGAKKEDLKLQIQRLMDENDSLKKKISQAEQSMSDNLQKERQKNASLTEQLQVTKRLLEESTREQEAMADYLDAERSKWKREENTLRKKLLDASVTIEDLLTKLSSCSKN